MREQKTQIGRLAQSNQKAMSFSDADRHREAATSFSLASERSQKARDKRGALGQFADDHVFVRSVSAIANRAKAIERGHADCRCEISVGTAACGRFSQRQPQIVHERLRMHE